MSRKVSWVGWAIAIEVEDCHGGGQSPHFRQRSRVPVRTGALQDHQVQIFGNQIYLNRRILIYENLHSFQTFF